MKNHIKRNYNGEKIKSGEILVPIMYSDFTESYCTNQECVKTISVGGRQFKVMYVAVPKEVAKYARNSFNLAVNEQLGHYTVKNSVSVNKLEDVYELEMEASRQSVTICFSSISDKPRESAPIAFIAPTDPP